MKKLLIVIITLLSLNKVVGQTLSLDSVPSVEHHLWKVNFFLPGIEYERALGNFATVNLNPYFGLGYSSNIALGSAWLVQPSLDVQFRRYYNLLKRSVKGKRTEGNSASFVAISVFGVGRSVVDAEDFRNHYYYGLGPIWGIQRTFRSNFNISFKSGLTYIRSEVGDERYLLYLNVRVGLALRKRSR
jgi:hypothetical protein